jgi:predicted HTH transcriptional regulator
MQKEEFLRIIDSGDFDLLVGETESDWLECKGEIYHLGENKGKRELAKDVSSFANSNEGGFILIGVEKEKSDQSQVDTIIRIRSFSEHVVNIEQYHNVIKEWVFPTLDVKIEWKKYRESNKGILIVTIPSQSEGRKPFLISKTIEDSGKRSEILFGYVERKRANSIPKKMIELHQIFRDGVLYETTINKRFDDLCALFQGLNLPTGAQEKLNKQMNEEILGRISDAIMNGGLTGHRKLIITGYTSEDVTLPEWSNSQSELIKSFENPPYLRQYGWDLKIGQRFYDT